MCETTPCEKPLMFSLFMDLIYGLENRQTVDWSGGKGARRTEERLQLLQITTSSPFTSIFDLHLPPSFHSSVSEELFLLHFGG